MSHECVTCLNRAQRHRTQVGALEEITLHNNGTESAVVAACGVDNHKVLVAVFGPVGIDAVRQDCERRLPAYMVPSLFLQVAQLPRLANQKADLRAIEKLAEDGLQKLRTSGTSGVENIEMFTDSLGMMRRLPRAHMQEMQWVQNQQAAWLHLPSPTSRARRALCFTSYIGTLVLHFGVLCETNSFCFWDRILWSWHRFHRFHGFMQSAQSA